MGGLHNFFIGVTPHNPSRKVSRCELGLGMSWGHIDYQSVDFAISYIF
jgi:hypothetical protein